MGTRDPFDAARRLVRDGTASAYPAAVVEVGRHDGVLWEESFGTTSRDRHAQPTTLDAVFDLASLTKVLSTTTLMMVATDESRLAEDIVAEARLPAWRGADREHVTLDDFLTHASGLAAHLPFYRDHHGRRDFEWAISRLALEYEPRTMSIYSDLGFILLGFVLEDAFGESLDRRFLRLANDRGWRDIAYRPDAEMRRRAIPTEVDRWRGRRLVGEVHDENAWALGGVAGHAGLFGTAAAVGRLARDVLAGLLGTDTFVTARTIGEYARRSHVSRSTRARGWDTMVTTSSCGTKMSHRAIGHTGFTGTSLWIDPVADMYAVLLTNRVCPTRNNNELVRLRPAFHDAVVGAVGVVSGA